MWLRPALMLHAFQREKENNDREIVLDSDENL